MTRGERTLRRLGGAAALAALALWYRPVLGAFFLEGDDYKILTAARNPGASSWRYWLFMFTHPAVNAPQYRPLSYFAIPYAARAVFGADPRAFHAAALALFLVTVVLCRRWLSAALEDERAALLGTFCYALYGGHWALLPSLANLGKYYLPLAALLLGLLWSARKEPLTLGRAAALGALTAAAVAAQEGAFVFPLVFFLQARADGRGRERAWLAAFLPSAAYLLLRLTVWGVPHAGFMDVSWTLLPFGLVHFAGVLVKQTFSPRWPPDVTMRFSWAGASALAAWTAAAAWERARRRENRSAFSLLAALAILAPFSVLRRHLFLGREIWAAPMAALLVGVWSRRLLSGLRGRALPAVALAAAAGLAAKAPGQRRAAESVYRFAAAGEREYLDEVSSLPPDGVVGLGGAAGRGPGGALGDVRKLWLRDRVEPGLLALRQPRRTYVIALERGGVLVRGGTFFYSQGGRWYDSMGHPQDVRVPEATSFAKLRLPGWFGWPKTGAPDSD
ncbi:MAG: hypothetical protein KGM24_04320 [Elusimicrobia bacterium]|nr:hypothetical protein [Elusimicrobiota bacterium]